MSLCIVKVADSCKCHNFRADWPEKVAFPNQDLITMVLTSTSDLEIPGLVFNMKLHYEIFYRRKKAWKYIRVEERFLQGMGKAQEKCSL